MTATASERTARRWGARLLALFISVRVATVLLLVFLAVTVLGAVLDQGRAADYYDQRYGAVFGRAIVVLDLDDVFGSGWFLALLALITAQILLCAVSRFRTAWTQFARPWAFRAEGAREAAIHGVRVETVVSEVERLGYRRVGSPGPVAEDGGAGTDGAMLGGRNILTPVVLTRGRLQPLGFLVLHVSLLVLLAGVALDLAAGFRSTLYLPVGQRVLERNTNRLLEVVEIEPTFVERSGQGETARFELSDMVTTVAVYEGGRLLRSERLQVGSDLSFDRGRLSLLPALERGQVVIRVTSPQGSSVVERLWFENAEVSLRGSQDLVLRVDDFAPDAVSGPEGWLRGSFEMRAPRVALSVVRFDDSGTETQVAEADLGLGGSFEVEGYAVMFVDAVYMPVGVVSSRRAGPLVGVGIVSNLLGIVLSLAFSFRHIRVEATRDGVLVTGFVRRRNQLFAEEFDRVVVGAGGGAER